MTHHTSQILLVKNNSDCRMNRKRKICKTEIDEERDFIHKRKDSAFSAGIHAP